MKRICAWCGRRLGEDVEPLDDDRETHGICAACRERESKRRANRGGDVNAEARSTQRGRGRMPMDKCTHKDFDGDVIECDVCGKPCCPDCSTETKTTIPIRLKTGAFGWRYRVVCAACEAKCPDCFGEGAHERRIVYWDKSDANACSPENVGVPCETCGTVGKG